MVHIYRLPEEIRHLVHARNQLRARYENLGLRFTLDGNLVGDLGEAVAAELFGLELRPRGTKGVDGIAPDGRTVQIKATGRGATFAFTHTDGPAEWLIGLAFNYEQETVEVVYNGPYGPCIPSIPWIGQRSVGIAGLRARNQSYLQLCGRKPLVILPHHRSI